MIYWRKESIFKIVNYDFKVDIHKLLPIGLACSVFVLGDPEITEIPPGLLSDGSQSLPTAVCSVLFNVQIP